MAQVITHRFPVQQQAINAESVQNFYRPKVDEDEDWRTKVLWGPLKKNESYGIKMWVKTLLIEMGATFVRTLILLLTVVAAYNTTVDPLIRSLAVAVAYAAGLWLVTGWTRRPAGELPHYGSWNLVLCRFLSVFGIVPLLLYLIAQVAGSCLAALVIMSFGPGTPLGLLGPARSVYLPQPTTGTVQFGTYWGMYILIPALVVFTSLYTQYCGTSDEESMDGSKIQRKAQVFTAITAGVSILFFFFRGGWAWDPLDYLTGLFATGFSGEVILSADAALFQYTSWLFHMGVPLIGMVAGTLVFVFFLFMSDNAGRRVMLDEKSIPRVRSEQQANYIKNPAGYSTKSH
jgi:hypothetical protein